MKIAAYPQRKCRDGIWNDMGIAYTCELPDLHRGPCATFSVKASVQRRDRWEEEHPGWEGQTGKTGDIVL